MDQRNELREFLTSRRARMTPRRPPTTPSRSFGDFELTYEGADLRGDDDLTLFVYISEAGSPTADALDVLASCAATQQEAEHAAAARHDPDDRS